VASEKDKEQGPDRRSAHSIALPDPPAGLDAPVRAWRQDVEILTWVPESPDLNPMFLERRVYQGSSGRVYPLPFIDRIAEQPHKKMWDAVHIENQYLRLMILPDIGGRIHIGFDKTTGYDFFYRQNVIKPALVGLAGPWISGGVEFNWPQHHRPATFMPVQIEIESEPDGSVTVWCSDHDPMLRMKGMHGVCLHPDEARLELRVRLFNRTPFTQTFLWWANVATRVHEKYQSFFPGDVRYVADHARRAVTTFPLSDGNYYGVDYGERARTGVPKDEQPRMFRPDGSYAPNDLSWYANIPVPTSYMVTATEEDFSGGYDHKADAGVVHVANHHIAPGKKQWTWGNQEFGYAWDRSLTEDDGPYIELMAGVYTDNQPDFSFLGPWETKTFTQNWYPIHGIGVPTTANQNAAVSLIVENESARVGVCVTRPLLAATVVLKNGDQELGRWISDLSVSEPAFFTAPLGLKGVQDSLAFTVNAEGKTLIEFDPTRLTPARQPVVAQEPAPPEELENVEELYLTGLHLEQYRHATRQPELYWQEGLRRDPEDSRINNAMGLWRLRRGEFEEAVLHFERAIARLTRLNPNPRDGEPYYNLGLALRYQGRAKEAYDAFYKAAWSAAWRGPAYFALAEGDAARGDWLYCLDHAERCLRADADNLTARNLLAMALKRMGESDRADEIVSATLRLDPLDIGARWQRGIAPSNGQECLDLAFDLLRAGQDKEALRVLSSADLKARDGSVPLILLAIAQIQKKLGNPDADHMLREADAAPVDYCFPSRLEEMEVLRSTINPDGNLWSARYLLGNLLYDKRRYEEAIETWEAASQINPEFAVLHRNLGIAYFNVLGDPARALDSFDRAFKANPGDARILYERDQLWKRVGKSPERRLEELLRHSDLVQMRDDVSVELATLYNQLGRPEDALALLLQRKFQPWEGGEGMVLAQYVRSRLLLGRRALDEGEFDKALTQFEAALRVPESLGEAKHLLANQSDIFYCLGEVSERQGKHEDAVHWWNRVTLQKGDFQQMAVRTISDMTIWTALAYRRLGRNEEANRVLDQIAGYSFELERAEPKIDFFATSLPAMLLFNEDLRRRNRIDALFLRAQAAAGREDQSESRKLLSEVLELDGNHAGAADLLRQTAKRAETIAVS